MNVQLVLTVVSEDKPGVVEAIAKTVADNSGNWLESRLAQLAGKFAGVVNINVPKNTIVPLKQALTQLEKSGIIVHIDELSDNQKVQTSAIVATFSAIGPDRPGIVRELSQALVEKSINVMSIETELSSMPYSGEPLFQATGQLSIPEENDLLQLREKFDEIADHLALDVSIKTDD